jgi:hypothetical protein
MKVKVLAIVMLVVGILITGCGGTNTSNPTPTPTATVEYIQEPPQDVTWINPGKVQVENFYAGATAEYTITVHNGNDYSAKFIIKYRIPDHVGEGYSFPSDDVSNWITISGNDVNFNAYETKDILVSITMPEDATAPGKKWEFWISVIDDSQGGSIRTEQCVRWLITME